MGKENKSSPSSIYLLTEKLALQQKIDTQQTDSKTTSTKGKTCKHCFYIKTGKTRGVDSHLVSPSGALTLSMSPSMRRFA